MDFKKAIEFIDKNKNKAVVGVNRKQKEIFVIDFFDFDDEGYVRVSYEKDLGDGSAEEATYDMLGEKEECLENHPELENMDFFEVELEKANSLFGLEFGYQLKILNLKQ